MHILVYDRVILGEMGVDYVYLYFQVVCIFVAFVCLVVCLKEKKCMKGIVINVWEILYDFVVCTSSRVIHDSQKHDMELIVCTLMC